MSVVMPFAGTAEAAREAIAALRSLDVGPGDELILVDNTGSVGAAEIPSGVSLVAATRERSAAHARNVGASHARRDWILFLDADTRPPPGLLAAFWNQDVDEDVGAVAGEIVPAPGTATLSGRYGSSRSFLGQQAHQAHPFRPRAAAANLMVRRAAFEQLGGFYEGVRAAEDTDFTWRLQETGWRLELRGEARVEHRYRTSLGDLRRQWRGYAAGRAWLARRYDGFVPEPAVRRALRRALRRPGRPSTADPPPPSRPTGERARFFALDALLSVEELAGFALSNRPRPAAAGGHPPVAVVLVADRFPARGDPLVELADSLDRVRVEAVARPTTLDVAAARRLSIDYLEDDGYLSRLVAAAVLALRHPRRVLFDAAQRAPDQPPLRLLAPAALRLERDPEARLQALGGGRVRRLAERLARLAGRGLD
jgi:GT2 family glycosyltransferase